MSTNSYAHAGDIMKLYPMIIQTANIQLDALEIYGDMADGDINGKLSRRYAVPFAASLYPIEPVRTVARKKWAYNFLRSRITQEDPSRSDWVDNLNKEADAMLQDIADGKVDVIALANTTSAYVVGQKADNRTTFWSSTKDYKPTADLRPAEEQRIDPDRLDDMADADD